MKRLLSTTALIAALFVSGGASAIDLGPKATASSSAAASAAASASARQRQTVNVDASSRNTNRNSNWNSASQKQSQGQGQSNTIEGDVNPRQAPSFAAPSLAVSPETCMGSTSAGGGVSAGAVGISAVFGSTWSSEECQRRLDSQALRLCFGVSGIAERACLHNLAAGNPRIISALKAAGYTGPLPGDQQATGPAPLAPAAAPVQSASAGDQHPACAPGSWASKDWRAANCR